MQTTVQQSTASSERVRPRSHARHYGTRAHYSACKSCWRSTSVRRRLIASTIIGHPQPCGLQRGRNGYGRQPQGTRASLSVCEFRLNGASHDCLPAVFGAKRIYGRNGNAYLVGSTLRASLGAPCKSRNAKGKA